MTKAHLRLGALLCLLINLPTVSRAQAAKPSEKKPPAAQPEAKRPAIDPKADSTLKEMSNYLRNLPSFSFIADFTTEVVLVDGEKLNFSGKSDVMVDRRFGIRSDRKDPERDVSLFYNGDNITVYKRGTGFYASAKAPKKMDDAIDFARDELGLEAPGADLLYSNPYSVLTEGMTSAKYLGVEEVNGVSAHHLAVRGEDTDVQVWVQTGGTPVPVKYVLTTKDVKGFPQYIVDLTQWDVAPLVSTEMFTFVPPAGAEKIEFRRRGGAESSRAEPEKRGS